MTMMRNLGATAILLLVSIVAVVSFTPLVPASCLPKEAAVKSPLFRAPIIPVQTARKHSNVRPFKGIKKHMRHAAVLTTAALVWRGAHVPEANARTKTKEPPARVKAAAKQAPTDEKRVATDTASTIFLSIGAGVVLGSQIVKGKKKTKTTDGGEADEERLKKQQEAQKILERIQEERKEAEKLDASKLRANAQEETRKILERIRLEREQKKAILNPESPSGSFVDQPRSNGKERSGAQWAADKLSTSQIVNSLIEKPEPNEVRPKIRAAPETKTMETSASTGTKTPPAEVKETVSVKPPTVETKASPAQEKPKTVANSEVKPIDAAVTGTTKPKTPSVAPTPTTPSTEGKQETVLSENKPPAEAKASFIKENSPSLSESLAKPVVPEADTSSKTLPNVQKASQKSKGKQDIFSKKPPATESKPSPVKEKTEWKEASDTSRDTVSMKSSAVVQDSQVTKTNSEIFSKKPPAAKAKPSPVTEKTQPVAAKSEINPVAKVTGTTSKASSDATQVSQPSKVKQDSQDSVSDKHDPPTPITVSKAESPAIKSDVSVNENKSTAATGDSIAEDKKKVVSDKQDPAAQKVPESKSEAAMTGKSPAPLAVDKSKPAQSGKPKAVESSQPASSQTDSADATAPVSPGKQLDQTAVDAVKKNWRPLRSRKYASIDSMEEKAFTILSDLGMIEQHPDPTSSNYDSSMDDEFVE